MSREMTLTSAKEIFNFFEKHYDKLNFEQMKDIVDAYTGGEFRVIRFKVIGQDEIEDELKRDFIKWINENQSELDKSELPLICFIRIGKN